MNYVKFVSNHYSNIGTSITLTKNYLILENTSFIEIFDLNKLTINDLESIKTLSIKSNPINIDNLVIEYDNRGEPYASGVTLSINETSVFLDYQDLDEFIDFIKQYLILVN